MNETATCGKGFTIKDGKCVKSVSPYSPFKLWGCWIGLIVGLVLFGFMYQSPPWWAYILLPIAGIIWLYDLVLLFILGLGGFIAGWIAHLIIKKVIS